MSIYMKTILLNNKTITGIKSMALLRLEKTSNGFFGKIKCYNIENKNLILGIKFGDTQVIKQNIQSDEYGYSFKLNNNVDLNENIGCVILTEQLSPIIWGSSNALDYKNQIVKELKNNISTKSMTTEKIIEKPEVQSSITEVLTEPTSNNAIHSDLFEYTDAEILEQIDNELDETPSTDTAPRQPSSFFDMISEQIDELFDKYPIDENLSKIIPDSKWVRVDFENNGKYYVVGLIYENGTLKFVCYGVPSKFSMEPPDELKDISQWVPLDPNNPNDEGYFIMYQDAITGDTVNQKNA